ncbi:MAG: hypothetical protein K2I42_02610 [Anaeroplasmataceae bacterium]|nr:hypothetical protein [Anaeroplasmataceae bacterium]
MMKLSRVSFFLFVTIFNYLWLRIIMFPYFYNEYGSMGLYYTGIVGVVMIIIFLVFPKKLMLHSYEETYKNSFFKYFYSIIKLLETIFGISFCIYLLSKIFIPTGNFYFMLGFILLTIIVLSYYSPKDVMEISTLFVILGYAILSLTLFFQPNLDAKVFLPIKQTSYWALPLFVLMFFGDNLTFLIYKKDISFSKNQFIMAIIVSLIFFGLEYFIFVGNAGDIYFKNLNWVGFMSLSIEPITRYLGNFDFAYIFYIMICCIFKYAFNLSLVRNNILINHKLMSIILFVAIFSMGCVSYLFIPMESLYFKVIASLLMISVLIIFWYIKECYRARKTKE